MAEGHDRGLLWVRRGELAHEALDLGERVVSCVEGGVGRRLGRDVPTRGRAGHGWTRRCVLGAGAMRARGRSLVRVHAVAGARGGLEGQESKLRLCDGATREIHVDVRMAHLP